MSRFKLFGIMAAMIASIQSNTSISPKEKSKQTNALSNSIYMGNRFSYPSRKLNQRQVRKRRRQNPNSSKWAA